MFIAEEVALSLVAKLRAPLHALREHDASLADQARRAATSVALNVSEGGARKGKDRLHCFRIADGSARELSSALRIAESWGYVDAAALADARGLIHRMLGLLWRLGRRDSAGPGQSP